ncbi:glycoside hydrolase family 3 protein [Fistulina hepatica ATCC 64428]|uniref:beta-glucosidase n=1 Tax=Fistulina hepatica ATCC 64428 TaxID=1128425 RepID=A0A0D7APB8_9AGAR|nr:glycoside hydrolase family 3 protein [Fistulina hepatica ATCC 64428]
MPPSDFARVDIDAIVEQLTTDEAILLTAGVGLWYTHGIPRLGVPAIKVSDGPNGIRGNHFFNGTPAKCLPSATALGSTFDTDLIKVVGQKLLASESRLRAASVILAPTCNIQRNPLGGRSFESFSEDPHLSGIIASAYVEGVQSGGIGTTIKHFVGNDKENDRFAYDSIMSERALREVYLMPFMLAQRFAKPWSFMTAYNRVNGTHVSENPAIIQDILRREWGFEGLVMSDWFGVYSVDTSLNAGLDLEMPGEGKWRSLDLVKRSIASRKVTLRTIKERARKTLEMAQRCAKEAPDVLDNDDVERTVESEEDKVLMRRVAAQSIVLLKNDSVSSNGDTPLLPLKPRTYKKIAIVGGNAKAVVLSGGGSASLKPSYFISPFEGISRALKDKNEAVEITYSAGAQAYMQMPTLDYDIFTEDGTRGWTCAFYSHTDDIGSMMPVDTPIEPPIVLDETRVFFSMSAPKGLTQRWTARFRGQLKPRERDGEFEFGLCSAGRAKLFVDGRLVIDNWTRQKRGDAFFGVGSLEERGTFPMKANTKYNILVEFCNVRAPADGDEDEIIVSTNPGVRLGGAEVRDADELMDEAVAMAKEADTVIAIVGLNSDWETEGYDRTTLALPGRTDELVEKVAAANPKTVVVTQSGSSITLPWADSVPAIVHAWYLGNATGDAIADVLLGEVNSSAKLSLTFPKREEDLPSYGHFHSENGKVRYAEDLFVGYKSFVHRNIKPLFAFGHGLSYTTFNFSDLQVGEPVVDVGNKTFSLPVSVAVTNTGAVAGSEVVQVYTSLPPTSDLTHPPLQLKAFAKVHDLAPGATERVELVLDKYAVSYWHDVYSTWVIEKGVYTVRVGSSSDDLPLQVPVNVSKGFEWRGL